MNSDASKLGGIPLYQSEPLIVRLKNLIRDYPEGIGIFQELIQNADDAGARLVKFTLDWRTHQPERLPDERMKKLMGPAMLVFNDQVFTDKDFENIRNLGRSGKTENLCSTGRFGVGFNSIYHVTDYPSFISRDSLIFFDPHGSAIPGTSLQEPGRRFKFAEEGWWEDYPSFMRLYQVQELKFGVDNFKGTLGRLPLRTKEHVRNSEIRKQTFNKDNVTKLLEELEQSGENLLLFLKSVEEIQVYEIPVKGDGSPQERLIITTKNRTEVRTQRSELKKALKPGLKKLLEQFRIQQNALPEVCYLHQIETTSTKGRTTTTTTSTWRISSVVRLNEEEQLQQKEGELLQAVEEMFEQGEKAVPWAGAAAKIATSSSKAGRKPVEGLAYCFLPLQQIKTGFPIHINGFFDLNSSRDNLTSDSGQTGKDSIRVKWNKLLVRHVVSRACANLIAGLVEDIGEEKPKEFYEFWPVNSAAHPVFADLPNHLIKLLSTMKVIRSTSQPKWLEPSKVYILPPEGKDVMEPLSADGMVFTDPQPPEAIVSAFAKANLGLYTIKPMDLRKYLTYCYDQYCNQGGSLGVPLEQAFIRSLSKREWIVNLLRFCINDGHKDLRGLPLAILADGTLQAFGNNPQGFMYMADDDAMRIFAEHPQWFLDPEFGHQIPELSRRTWEGLSKMTAAEVAQRLLDVIGSAPLAEIEWQPDNTNPPNINWLALVYRYFARINDKELPLEALKKVPLVPGNDGKLHQGGYTNTPLLCASGVAAETRSIMRCFQIPLVEAPAAVLEAIAQFVKRHPNKFIWHLTVPDVIDTLATIAKSGMPRLDIKNYESLLNFLASDRVWLNGEGKNDQDRKKNLRQLKIYPTTSNQLVTLNDEKVYITSEFYPPKVAGSLNLLRLGNNQQWKPLFQILGVKVLDQETLICNFLLPGYAKFNEQEQLSALTWIRDGVADLKKKGQLSHLLKTSVSQAPLVRCTDGKLRSIASIYDPESEVVREVLGDKAFIPDMEFYPKDNKCWLNFFHSLGILNTPSASDILAYVKSLIAEYSTKPNTVVNACRVIFDYVTDNWEILNSWVREGHVQKKLGMALKPLAWLPVERCEQELKRYPGYKIPEAKLYRAEDVYFIQNAHLVASQKPLFRGKPLSQEIQNALGFSTQVELQVVIQHFEILI